MTLVPLGRPRKPTSVRVAEGMRGHRPLPDGEPKPRVVTPECPAWFSPLQREAWDGVVRSMSSVAGWVTEEQGPLLAVLAEAFATWVETTRILSEHGRTYLEYMVDPSGTEHTRPRARPEVKIQKDARGDVLRYSAALGLGPVFRARVNLMPQSEHEDLDRAP